MAEDRHPDRSPEKADKENRKRLECYQSERAKRKQAMRGPELSRQFALAKPRKAKQRAKRSLVVPALRRALGIGGTSRELASSAIGMKPPSPIKKLVPLELRTGGFPRQKAPDRR